MKKYSALVLGASGFIGRTLVNLICVDNRYESVCCLVRKPLTAAWYHDPDKKIHPLVIEFDNLQDYQGYFNVDHVYCCIGYHDHNNMPSSHFRRVNFEYIHVVAQLVRAQRVKSFVWVSRAQADAKSDYLPFKVAGELENAILSMPQLRNATAVKPGLVVGHNQDNSQTSMFSLFKKQLSDMTGFFSSEDKISDLNLGIQMIKLHVFSENED